MVLADRCKNSTSFFLNITVTDFENRFGISILHRTWIERGKWKCIAVPVFTGPAWWKCKWEQYHIWELVELPWKPSFNDSLLCQCVAMQQIDKVKHEGQILPNIDLSKQSPLLCCPDVTTVSVHYSKSNSVWKQLCHTVNIVATVQAKFFCVVLDIWSCFTSGEFNILKMGNIKLKWKYFNFNSHINEVIVQILYNAVQPFWFWSSVFVLSTL